MNKFKNKVKSLVPETKYCMYEFVSNEDNISGFATPISRAYDDPTPLDDDSMDSSTPLTPVKTSPSIHIGSAAYQAAVEKKKRLVMNLAK